MNQTKKVQTVKELNDFFKGKEIMVVGDHEHAGTITKFICMVNKDCTQANDDDKPTKDLRMCVDTPFSHTRLYLEPKNIFVITNKQKPQSIWN